MSPRIAAGKKVALRPLGPQDAAELARAIEETREELKRRHRWAGGATHEAAEETFIKANPDAVAIVEAKDESFAGVGAVKESGDLPGLAELTFWIRASKQDRGLGTDAALNLVERAFKGKAHKVWARVDPGNRAGRRVLQKLGFKFEGCLRREKRLNGRWADLECWGLLKEEWKR